jgi:hypothetical protein
MQIRALTGFDSQTLEKYGRSYSPMNGTCSPGIGGFDIPYTIPSYVPPQKIEMLDPQTGKKKIFSIQNINQLTQLITQGFMLFSSIKGSGQKTVQGPKPTDAQIKAKSEGTSLSFAGLNITTIVGVGIAAIFLTRLMKQ